MTRRTMLQVLGAAVVSAVGFRWVATASGSEPGADSKLPAGEPAIPPLELTDDQWKAALEPAAYSVLRHEDTERPGSSPLNHEKRAGTFVCAGCFLPLFRSNQKYDSGTGWPSFFDVLAGHVGTQRDFGLLLPRTEYHCARCKGHQGHVFTDGPKPTGLRYCNNGVALRFVAEGETLPALREKA